MFPKTRRPKTSVKCHVHTCFFWSKDSVCSAKEIEIKENLSLLKTRGGLFVQSRAETVKTTRETRCSSFRPRKVTDVSVETSTNV